LRQSKEEAVAAAPEDQQDHFAAEPVGWAPPYRNIPPHRQTADNAAPMKN